MSWRDQLREASFRGVPFHIDDDDLTSGRRTVEHDHPETDGITAEDLGRQARKFRITGYVLGAEYMAARDRLLAALEERGPGTLVHPQYGERQVVVARDGIGVRHTTREGGVATFTLSFVEVDGTENRPVAVADTEAQVQIAADSADFGEITWSQEALAVDGEPGWTVDDLAARAERGIAMVEAPFNKVRARISKAQGTIGRFTSLYGRAMGLLALPGALAAALANTMNMLPRGGSGGSASRSTWAPVATEARTAALIVATTAPAALAPTPTGQAPDTPARRRQAALQETLAGTVTRLALVAAARASASEQFASREEAEAVRETLSDALDAVLLTAPDEVYAPLAALHAATVRHLSVQAAGLVPLRRLSTTASRPALALAHDLYGDDPTRTLVLEADLVARNRVRHPGFVPAATDLEVLAR